MTARRTTSCTLALCALLGCATPTRVQTEAAAHSAAPAPTEFGSQETRSGSAPEHHAEPATALHEEVISTGGELSFAAIPAATIQRAKGEIVAWGLAEVPGDSRLQAALALVDANVRAELLSSIRVGITSSLETSTTSVATRDASGRAQSHESQQVIEHVVQATAGMLPALAPIQHGWRKVRRDGVVILQLCARIVAPEETLVASLRSSLPATDDAAARARALLDRLGTGRPVELK